MEINTFSASIYVMKKANVKALHKVYESKIRLKESIIILDVENAYLKLILDLKLPYKVMIRKKNLSNIIQIIDYIYHLEMSMHYILL